MKIKTTFYHKADLGLGIRVLMRCDQVDTLDAAAGIIAIKVGENPVRRIADNRVARALMEDFLGRAGCLTASWSALLGFQKACLSYWLKAHHLAARARDHGPRINTTL